MNNRKSIKEKLGLGFFNLMTAYISQLPTPARNLPRSHNGGRAARCDVWLARAYLRGGKRGDMVVAGKGGAL